MLEVVDFRTEIIWKLGFLLKSLLLVNKSIILTINQNDQRSIEPSNVVKKGIFNFTSQNGIFQALLALAHVHTFHYVCGRKVRKNLSLVYVFYENKDASASVKDH